MDLDLWQRSYKQLRGGLIETSYYFHRIWSFSLLAPSPPKKRKVIISLSKTFRAISSGSYLRDIIKLKERPSSILAMSALPLRKRKRKKSPSGPVYLTSTQPVILWVLSTSSLLQEYAKIIQTTKRERLKLRLVIYRICPLAYFPQKAEREYFPFQTLRVLSLGSYTRDIKKIKERPCPIHLTSALGEREREEGRLPDLDSACDTQAGCGRVALFTSSFLENTKRGYRTTKIERFYQR